MKRLVLTVVGLFSCIGLLSFAHPAQAALTLTSGNNATTTPSVATSITGFQIVGPAASTTPVKIHVTNGTVHVSTIGGVTMTGNDTATLNLSGTVTNLNSALSTLSYTRSSTGSDTLEVALVNSDQIYFPTNGHVYQYVASSLDWNTANTAAQALTAYSAHGYLVTITSSTENDFVKARLSGNAWIGASDAAVEGDWKWVTGPEAGTSFWLGAGAGHTVGGQYASWNGGEPNDSGGNEDCGEEYVADGTWNDLPCSGTTVDGYVAEFGNGADMPNVVSKNVSIVTADVPAVTTLFPATGATNATSSANLVISFTKTVTVVSGNVLLKKSSDDSLVESIDVTSGKVTGSGTGSIVINPDTVLGEGVQYYVIIPATAFKDGSNNFFDGISASTTWTFTTIDPTPPSITALTVATTTDTGVTIVWTTNENASSKVVYSTASSFSSTTSETDTSPRVVSHTKSLTGLSVCTTYNYKAVSADVSFNYATTTSAAFTTTGCAGGAVPTSATTTTVTVSAAATSTATDTGRTLSVVTPANFTATSSSVVIQIKGLSSDTVLASIGKPSSTLLSAATIVFDVTALVNNTTVLDSFDTPVTISYTYTDADISGLDESTLTMYHYHGGLWLPLNNCSVDTSGNKITCNAPSFSTFAIFGSLAVVSNSSGSSSGSAGMPWCSSPLAPGWNSALQGGGCGAATTAIATVATTTGVVAPLPPVSPASPVSVCPAYTFTRTLRYGMKGEDVRALQKLMNCLGFTLGRNGPGSVGNETDVFAKRTDAAVKHFQEMYSSDILAPVSATKGTGIFAAYSKKKAKTLTAQ